MGHAKNCTLAVSALLATVLGGCELTNQTIVVEFESQPGAFLATSMDGDVVWATQEANGAAPSLRAYDAVSGDEILALPGWSADWKVRDLYTAYDTVDNGDVWVMHFNGYRTRWNEGGQLIDLESPISNHDFPVDSRVYCGLARDLSGVSFVSTIDFNGGVSTNYLYRHEAGQWTRVESAHSGCGQIDYDVATDEVAVLDIPGGIAYTVRWFDADSLSLELERDMPNGTLVMDFASFNHQTAWVGGILRVLDESGNICDEAHVGNARGVDVQYGDNQVRLWFIAADDFPADSTQRAGWYQLQ